MRAGMRITRDNIHMLADDVGVSAKDLYNEMVNAKLSFRKEQDKRWSYEFFGKDEAWYDATMKEVQEIRDSLPRDMSPNERTVKLYGWIERYGKKNLSLPMMHDENISQYAHAVAVEYALTNPDVYHRAMNWD